MKYAVFLPPTILQATEKTSKIDMQIQLEETRIISWCD